MLDPQMRWFQLSVYHEMKKGRAYGDVSCSGMIWPVVSKRSDQRADNDE